MRSRACRKFGSGFVPAERRASAFHAELEAAYAQMARDEAREIAALEWAEAMVRDVAISRPSTGRGSDRRTEHRS
jgi:hypothetical protein